MTKTTASLLAFDKNRSLPRRLRQNSGRRRRRTSDDSISSTHPEPRRRRRNVFAGFDRPGIINAKTENANGRLKGLHRRVRGYTKDPKSGGFEAFRLTVLHKLGARTPGAVAERMAADAILTQRAPARGCTEAELEEITDQVEAKLARWTRRSS